MVLDAQRGTIHREHEVVVIFAMKHKKKPSTVNATPEVAEFIRTIDKGSYLEKIIVKTKEELSDNMFCGECIQRKQIPRYYIRKYKLNNLYVMDLDSSKRLSYTLLSNGVGVGVYLLEVFLTHKDYETRFGYT